MATRGAELQAHKIAVFNRLFDDYWAPIRRHVESVLEDEQDVSDLVADVFVVVWEKLKPAKPWGLPSLIRTADNKLKDFHRKAGTSAKTIAALQVRGIPGRKFDVLDAFSIRQALNTVLTPRERRIVVLAYWDQLSAGEIAEVLECSQSSAWTTLCRARSKLAIALRIDADVVTGIDEKTPLLLVPSPQTV